MREVQNSQYRAEKKYPCNHGGGFLGFASLQGG